MSTPATFGSASSFIVLITGAGRTTEADMTATHIPGSDLNVIDIGGRLNSTISYDLYFTSASRYNSLATWVGASGALTTYDFAGSTAYLKSLRRSFVNSSAPYATFATAEFIAP